LQPFALLLYFHFAAAKYVEITADP